uniref:Uncharacterized protein n=1 Tax=Meloidogyne javanica TaxID=6303 RepID=A0A915N2X0_MELJA
MFNLCYSRYGQQPNRYVDYNNNYNQPPSNNYNNYYSGGRQQGGWGQSNNGEMTARYGVLLAGMLTKP